MTRLIQEFYKLKIHKFQEKREEGKNINDK